MKKIIVLLIISFSQLLSFSQDQKPKLVVGVVVDQMRYEYLSRFNAHFSENGFKKLMNDGFFAQNTHFSYVPTYTGPGHATVFTGTTPANHGIISNYWYDKFTNQGAYCVADDAITSVGTPSNAGKMSPHRMLTTTIGDQNRLHTQFRGKTFGVSIKDRGAILPAGHTANAAYWFVGEDEGKFVSSSFYMDELPKWVKKFNKNTSRYFKVWETIKPISSYVESGPDNTDYEVGFKGKDTPTFPYNLEKLKSENKNFDILKTTPFANDMLTDFALQMIKNEELGKDNDTDFLTLSYSSTDYAGHNFGVNAKEIQDMYIRLDDNIARLIDALDKEVGKGNYTLFLTSDHGVVHVPQLLKDIKIPAGYIYINNLRNDIKAFVEEKFGDKTLIEEISSQNIFFDYAKLDEAGIKPETLERALYYFLLQYDKIDRVFTREMIEFSNAGSLFSSTIKNGFHPKRSGDVIFVFEPAHISSYSKKGTTHGTYFSYDTQAPLLFYGQGIVNKRSYKRYNIRDIAPTIAALLQIAQPNGTTGKIIEEAIKP
jgi:predicted AlkP superfamily pyrophosphatase or phosphodiesterase